jgi:hypothetical protein
MAIMISQNNKSAILQALRNGEIDTADIAFPNLIDDIILKMNRLGAINSLAETLGDRRSDNSNIPFSAILALFTAAKMKIHTSLTDVPYAINDAEALSEIGWNIWESERSLNEGLMTEGALRNIVKKYEAEELVDTYNKYVQGPIFEKMDIRPVIHLLDCTWLEVEIKNANYEESEVTKEDGVSARGYKLGTLRGICGDTGILEEIKIGKIKTHDLALCEDMLKNSLVFNPGDILINDRGFISRELINYMKTERGVDVYVPLRKNMEAFEVAVSVAKEQGDWSDHPNKKRKKQKIAYVNSLGAHWIGDDPKKDVEIVSCVVWDKGAIGTDTEYRVFITTDIKATARRIIKTYEIRPEIEEDYRQIKDFWEIEDFKSTKYKFIVFHVIMVLVGYLYFQLFRLLPEGKDYIGKSLPVALKKYVPDGQRNVVCYWGSSFGVFEFLEFLDIYASLDTEVKTRLRPILARI